MVAATLKVIGTEKAAEILEQAQILGQMSVNGALASRIRQKNGEVLVLVQCSGGDCLLIS